MLLAHRRRKRQYDRDFGDQRWIRGRGEYFEIAGQGKGIT